MKLMTVEAARTAMLATATPGAPVTVATGIEALGRVLARDIVATRDQPPFDAAAMDGYAVRAAGLSETEERRLQLAGESAAGRGYLASFADDEAVRIFTGAPVPAGTAFVVPQENTRREGDQVILTPRDQSGPYIRRQGGDFRVGAPLLSTGQRLDPWRIGLAASAGLGQLWVHPRPRIAILSTGEELVNPGETPGPDQIFDSGSSSLSALVTRWGAEAIRLTPTGDRLDAIAAALAGVQAELIVTVGGASVGDHDLVKPALATLGLHIQVASVAVRPGKPTWFGCLGDGRRVLGLPGNPASALVCAELFLRPLIDALSGARPGPTLLVARTNAPLAANGPREHWMRALLHHSPDGVLQADPLQDQDSSLVTIYAAADALLRRQINAPDAAVGDLVEVLPLMRD